MDSSDPLGILLITFNGIGGTEILFFVLILFLLICSALISGSEIAFFSLKRKQLDEIDKETKGSSRVLQLLRSHKGPEKLLATILIANNFVNVAIIILSDQLVRKLFAFRSDESLEQVLITVVGVTFFLLLFGEVLPKVYATYNAIKLSSLMAFPIQIMKKIFSPLSNLLLKFTPIIDKNIRKKNAEISVEDLEKALELTKDGDKDDEEHKMLKGIVRFGNTDVKQIMTPRTDITAFGIDTKFEDLIDGVIESGYSRIPVFEESTDQISGVFYLKDMLPHIDKPNFKWQDRLRNPFFVPENKKLDVLLREFQERKMHLAVVVDEYGGTSGIVTLEDILEEIVGEITDEFDDEDVVYTKLDEENYVFEGKTPLIDVYRIMEIDGEELEEAKGEADTLAGFIIEQAGKILQKNEKVKFNQFTFTVEAADKRKVKQVKISLGQNGEE
ncbi:MAG: gliding motility-associated protein GldE [Flavobacteriales bacterium]|nr:gliding motility-associated protein GldE [Flavobacteriales bacterium]